MPGPSAEQRVLRENGLAPEVLLPVSVEGEWYGPRDFLSGLSGVGQGRADDGLGVRGNAPVDARDKKSSGSCCSPISLSSGRAAPFLLGPPIGRLWIRLVLNVQMRRFDALLVLL
jgi:hypothetical protein